MVLNRKAAVINGGGIIGQAVGQALAREGATASLTSTAINMTAGAVSD